ncbi:hypothetical protein BGZ95_007203 [Linnemannia exigua]|uniref:O-acyltransferase n=1 Tax=Linnemannia exigua TaxID=604196 RepID=A0AAD4H8C3_9FUNG|nr:hypothetical protein BGZ95_007203 [Linnemannia exigua]
MTDSEPPTGGGGDVLSEVPPKPEDLKDPLSKEAPPESYRGFVNLGMLLLFGNNVRLIIENYQKYGILISLPGSKVSRDDWILTGLAHLLVPLNVILSYQLERWAMKRAIGHRKRLSELSSLDSSPASHGHTNAHANGHDDKDPKQALKDLNKAEASIKRTQKIFGWLHALNVIAILAWPSYMSYYKIFHPFMSITCLMNGTIQFLKMTSYSLTNQDLRAGYIYDLPTEKFQHTRRVHDAASNTFVSHQEVYEYEVNYPDNITFKDMAYFWFAPTLCYQPSYPRSTVFRKSFFLKRVFEALTCLGMMYFLIEQYATPTLQNSVRAFDQLAFGTMLERVLKLSTTSVLIWLLMFYTFFHATFNALAEMLYFGDRGFYLAWWNAGSVGRYWALWNRPVYIFFKRHIYLPMVTKGASPLLASFVIFTFSAIMHEILIGLPTHLIYGYAFAGMFFQIPLIALTRPLEKWRGTGTGLGNMIFWVSFTILGQPACALLYYYHWTKRHIDDGSLIPVLLPNPPFSSSS